MTDRIELLEAALDNLPDGIALFGKEGLVVFWNLAAEAITGYAGADVISRQLPGPLMPLITGPQPGDQEPCAGGKSDRGGMVHLEHQAGRDVLAMVRPLVLRDGLGSRIGTAVVFHIAESVEVLPHGECGAGTSVEAAQSEVETRLEAVFEKFLQGGESFGVMWITVDQAHEMRKTHGSGTCDAMLEKVERVLVNGLRPTEEMGRWGDDEFLVLSHECTPEMLAAHSQVLAGLTRTADFHWWGDRVPLTVSIGAAQAELNGSLADLLERAKAAMLTSFQAGGNRITLAAEGQECSPL